MASIAPWNRSVYAARAKRKTSEEWDRVKSVIFHLHFNEMRTLKGEKGIIESMAREHNFHASESQYRLQLRKWGFYGQRELRLHLPSRRTKGRPRHATRSPDASPADLLQQSFIDNQGIYNKQTENSSASSDLSISDVSNAFTKTRADRCSCRWARESTGRDAIPDFKFDFSFLETVPISPTTSSSNLGPLESCVQGESSRPEVPYIVRTDPACPVHAMATPKHRPHESCPESSEVIFDILPRYRTDFTSQYHHSNASPSLSSLSQFLENNNGQTSSMKEQSQRVVYEASNPVPSQEDLSKRSSNEKSVCRKPSSSTSPLCASPTAPEAQDDCQNTHEQPAADCSEEHPDSGNQSYASSISIRNWTEETNTARATPFSTLLSEDTSTIAPDSPVMSARGYLEEAMHLPCRELLLELLDIIDTGDYNKLDGENRQVCGESCQSVDSSTSAGEGEPEDSSDTTKSSGSGTRSTTSQTASEQLPGSKRPYVPDRDSMEGDDNEDKPPFKKPNREPEHSVEQDEGSSRHKLLIPCPILCPQKCLGTNASISELIRDLGSSHQVVVCIECCKLLDYVGDGKNAEAYLKKHKNSNECTRRCICQSHGGDPGTLHLPDADCSPTRSRKMAHPLWRFIWELVNPGQKAPLSQFSHGISCLHSNVRRPRTQRGHAQTKSTKARGCEVILSIADDRGAAEKQITVLDSDLKAANQQHLYDEIRLQQCSQKISERDEIITFLLERLIKYGLEEMDPSFQKRLYRVSPLVFHTALDFQTKMKQRSSGSHVFVEVIDSTIPKPSSPQPGSAVQEISQPTPSQTPPLSDAACDPSNNTAFVGAGDLPHSQYDPVSVTRLDDFDLGTFGQSSNETLPIP